MTLGSESKRQSIFGLYMARLVFRVGVLGYAVYLFFTNPEKLSVSEFFGPAHGFNVVDFIFIAFLVDILTKFFPHAPIAMGSLKQFREHHVPTWRTFQGGKEGLSEFVKRQWEEGKAAFANMMTETKEGIIETARHLMQNIDFLKLLKFREEDLTADEKLRKDIRDLRVRQVVPVIIVWIVLNAAIYLVLMWTGWLSEQTILLWALCFFVSDMVCVLFWCPFQILMMKNRCCTTCHIFNWDAIMVATPLVFLGGVFGWVLIGLALVVLLRWEVAFARHPERFDDRTNASLLCINCEDHLCRLRPPLFTK